MLSPASISKTRNAIAKRLAYIETQSRLHRAMADPTRLKIVMLLQMHKELCPTDIARILKVTLSAVSHQMRTLEQLGIVKKIRMGKMICYSLRKRSNKDLRI